MSYYVDKLIIFILLVATICVIFYAITRGNTRDEFRSACESRGGVAVRDGRQMACIK